MSMAKWFSAFRSFIRRNDWLGYRHANRCGFILLYGTAHRFKRRSYVVNTVETITIGASSEERLSLVGTVQSTGEAGVPYTSSLTATGGVTPYAWSIPTGSLPPGLTASPSTGVINGTPSMPGTFSFTAEVMDNLGATATAPESITINAQIMLAGGPLPLGVIGNAYATRAERCRWRYSICVEHYRRRASSRN